MFDGLLHLKARCRVVALPYFTVPQAATCSILEAQATIWPTNIVCRTNVFGVSTYFQNFAQNRMFELPAIAVIRSDKFWVTEFD
jgi:hypothetical protein